MTFSRVWLLESVTIIRQRQQLLDAHVTFGRAAEVPLSKALNPQLTNTSPLSITRGLRSRTRVLLIINGAQPGLCVCVCVGLIKDEVFVCYFGSFWMLGCF